MDYIKLRFELYDAINYISNNIDYISDNFSFYKNLKNDNFENIIDYFGDIEQNIN
jgi:hypothetical protein